MRVKKIAVIGAGGKTTAMELLAKENREKSVLVTTTTHIRPMQPPSCQVCLKDPSSESLAAALREGGIVCAGSTAKEGKLGILPKDVLETAENVSGLMIYEADGSRQHPLKLHQSYEPVILPDTDQCLVIAGLSALGKPANEMVHRYRLLDKWRDDPSQLVDKQDFLYCIMETVTVSGLSSDRIRIYLNQADTLENKKTARDLAEKLQARGYLVRWGSLRSDSTKLSDWIID